MNYYNSSDTSHNAEEHFRLDLYTSQNLDSAVTMQALWGCLMDGPVDPASFDSKADTEYSFVTEGHVRALDLYIRDGLLFVKGRNKMFLSMFSRQTRGLSTWHFWIDISAMQGGTKSIWLKWFFQLCADFPVLFGRGCASDEYEAKHAFVQQLSEGRRITGHVGVSVPDLYQFLPGIYWLTIFGEHVVNGLGKDAIKKLPDVTVTFVDKKQLAIVLTDDVRANAMDDRLAHEAYIADILGVNYFFSKQRPISELVPLPTLTRELNRLQNLRG